MIRLDMSDESLQTWQRKCAHNAVEKVKCIRVNAVSCHKSEHGYCFFGSGYQRLARGSLNKKMK